jgi:hypothetical protein
MKRKMEAQIMRTVKAGRRIAAAAILAGAVALAGILVLAGSVIVAGPTEATPRPAPSLPVSRAAAAAHPAAHVLPFAQDLRGARWKLPKGPSRVPVAWNVDGCDHDYGAASQCVPWQFPGSAAVPAGQGCAWLAAHGFGPLPVRGRDRLGLDTNQDAIACGPGDKGVKPS